MPDCYAGCTRDISVKPFIILIKQLDLRVSSEAGVRSLGTEFTNDVQYQELTLINLPVCGISMPFYLSSYFTLY
jgi:hypothetical protein